MGGIEAAGELAAAFALLREEAEGVYRLLGDSPVERLDRVTPFAGWTIGDVVRHLIVVDRQALAAIADPASFAAMKEAMAAHTGVPLPGEPAVDPIFARLRAHEQVVVGTLSAPDLLAVWRQGLVALGEACAAEAEDRKIAWFGPPMRVTRLLAARQMEYWCYGQDVFDALRVRRRNGAGLRTVCDFGYRTRGYAFSVNGLEPPPAPQVALHAPTGEVWCWGAQDAAETVTGTAEDFALVVTQRRAVSDTGLLASGPGAARWLRIAQTIAGGPYQPPAPNTRAWERTGGDPEPSPPAPLPSGR